MVWDSISRTLPTAKKTVNRVLKRAKEFDISWLLDENDTDAVLEEEFFPSANQVTSNKRMLDSAYIHKELLRNEVSKSFCGQNTWRTAVLTVRNRSCIPNSAITSSRMSRNDVLPCISIVNPANVIKTSDFSSKKQVRFSPVIPSGDLALSFGVLLSWFQQKDFFWSRFSKALMIEDLLPEGQESVLWCLN